MDSELQDDLDWFEKGVPIEGGDSPTERMDRIVKAARKYANPDYLRAAIGYGIDLQEAIDIVDLALGGGTMTPTLQRIYDEKSAALGVTEATDAD